MDKRIWSCVLAIPLTGVILLYSFIGCTLYKFGRAGIFQVDPMEAGSSFFYEAAYLLYTLGILMLLFLAVVSLGTFLIKRKRLLTGKALVLLIGLMIIYALSLLLPGGLSGYESWFFD